VKRETASLKVKKLHPNARLPRRATEGATGLDLFARIDSDSVMTLDKQPKPIATGIAIEVPRGYDAQIRPRSGLSAKGVGVTLGTVDSDYRGEVMVTMYLFGARSQFEVRDGDRIAQLVISEVPDLPLVEVQELSPTRRGQAGHGSTGDRGELE
jgi:dUTP pyrophosphatase